MEKYEKSEEHYNERYDRLTISILKSKEERYLKVPYKKDSKEFQTAMAINELLCIGDKIKLFDTRWETIDEWKNADRLLDKRVKTNPPLSLLMCLECDNKMEAITSIFKENDHRVLYVYDCTNELCKSRRSIYSDGEEYVSKTKYCPKCAGTLEHKDEVKQKVRVFTRYCLTCDYSNSIELELGEKEAEITKEDRLKYCHVTDKERELIASFKELAELNDHFYKVDKEKNTSKKYKLDQIEQLKIADLEKRLKTKIELKKFEKFQLDKPIIKHYVSIEFSVLDSSSRTEKESKTVLRKIIKNELLRTNWRLMTTDISYRLGFMTGKLRAYENQEELIKIGKEIIKFDQK